MSRRIATLNRLTVTALATMLLPVSAFAHTGPGTHGAAAGFLHPLTGLDHLLAMIAVGVWAVQLGGRMVWGLPLTFVACMLAGGLLAVVPVPDGVVEGAVLASVVLLGAVIALSLTMSHGLALVLVGGFALFHGHAHGAEMEAGHSAMAYGLGFLLSTAALHAVGVFGAHALTLAEGGGLRLVRVGGLGVMACGILMFVGVL